MAGALPEAEYVIMLEEAGFSDISIKRERVIYFQEEELKSLFPDLSPEVARYISGSLASAFVFARKNAGL